MERNTLITISMICLTIVSIFLIGWNVLLKNMDTCNVEYHCFEDNKNCSIILPISKNESLDMEKHRRWEIRKDNINQNVRSVVN